ncbi:MAG: glycosyltransferase [Clostridiales bacterium]|nr:glycosyltransferase [Clostridiales bacterium]
MRMEVNMKMVSIIIPIYNAQKTLRRCLDSCRRQTYQNIEVIAVNDGSIDKSMQICKSFQKSCSIKVLDSNVNVGVSMARNRGVAASDGSYILFLDSDDYLEDTAVETLIDQAGDYDLVVGSWAAFRNCKTKYEIRHKPVEYNRNEIKEHFSELDRILNTVWGKLYRKQIITGNHLSFRKEMTIGEDHLFNIEFLMLANSVRITGQVIYHYSLGGGLSTIRYHDEIGEVYLLLIERYEKLLKDETISFHYYNDQLLKIMKGVIDHYFICCSFETAKQRIVEVLEKYHTNHLEVEKGKNICVASGSGKEDIAEILEYRSADALETYYSKERIHYLKRKIVRNIRILFRPYR